MMLEYNAILWVWCFYFRLFSKCYAFLILSLQVLRISLAKCLESQVSRFQRELDWPDLLSRLLTWSRTEPFPKRCLLPLYLFWRLPPLCSFLLPTFFSCAIQAVVEDVEEQVWQHLCDSVTLQCIVWHCNALCDIAMYCVTLQCIVWHCNALCDNVTSPGVWWSTARSQKMHGL